MYHQEFEPPESLRDTIRCFWYDRREVGETETSFEVVPDGYAELIFPFGSLFRLSANGEQQPLRSPFLMGLLGQPMQFVTRNRLEIMGVRCFPWRVFDWLGLPAGPDSVRVVEHPVARLQTTLSPLIQAGKIDKAVEQLSLYFLDAAFQTRPDPIVSRAGEALRQGNGTLPVSQVAEAAHATVRTLERRFRHASGHTVKDVSGLMRVEQVRNHLWLHPDAGLAGLAHELGYTDQAHLSREFKRYCGITPGAFAREAKKDRQSLNPDFVAFVQA